MRHLSLIFIALAIFTIQPLYGQLTSRNFSIGPRIGVNFSNVSNPEAANSRTGLVAGLTSTYSINEHSGLSVDLLYSGEGYEHGETELALDYLRIPVMYNIFFGEWGQRFRPKVFAGLQPGVLLAAESDGTDVKSTVKNFSFGVGAGLGFNYRMGERTWLNTDLRSFFDLMDLREDPASGSDKHALRNIQLSVGVAWGL